MRVAISIGLVLLFLNSAFPPRFNPEWPDSQVRRVFILSKYFYFSHYSQTPFVDTGSKTYQINSSPAQFDWGRYVAECAMIICTTALSCLYLTRTRSHETVGAETSADDDGKTKCEQDVPLTPEALPIPASMTATTSCSILPPGQMQKKIDVVKIFNTATPVT